MRIHTFKDDPERALANLLPYTVVCADHVVGRGGVVGGHGRGRRGVWRGRGGERVGAEEEDVGRGW